MVKSGNCVKTGAQVLVLEYGRVQRADIFLVGDCVLINFADDVHNGKWANPGAAVPYQVIIGLDGFWHDKKNVLVVPKNQFQGEIIHRDGRRESLALGVRDADAP